LREGFLQQQCGDQRHEVGIAAAFAEAVKRALDLARARLDRCEGVGYRVARVVMGVDADFIAAKAFANDTCDARDLTG